MWSVYCSEKIYGPGFGLSDLIGEEPFNEDKKWNS